MEWEFFAPMVALVVLILTTGGVLVLRPIMRPLIELLEAMVREKERVDSPELGRIREVLENMDARLSLMEERTHFYEKLAKPERYEGLAGDGSPPRLGSTDGGTN